MRTRYIKTHRSKDIKRSALVVANEILKKINVGYGAKLGLIYKEIKKKNNIQQVDFIYALNFLFILGQIEYIKEFDEIKRIKNENI
ncbi:MULTISPECIES: ABC-three component system middle component 8 [Campylobacter]|uniref:ABC-three component system middle component 8 n=1 Tax=Campylobacter TaxID=194 RepID=UPI0007C9200B|nr:MULTISPECIES: ABC-three component system middle component 8 [Campylobacter]ANE33739.1 hypothetical protein CHL_0363 [Campylobacter hyointestinalis subsp. lawsonii CCUG 27631]